jgi:hypothetical protein
MPHPAECAICTMTGDERAEPRAATLSARVARLLRLVTVSSIVVVALVLLAEGVTRFALTSPSRQMFDAELGFRYLPNAEFFNGSEGGARLKLNSLGFNDAEVDAAHARRRVIFVGDSLTEAIQVERADNYVSRLKGLRPDLEFINLGQAYTGPLEYGVLLKRFHRQLKPDVTVLAFSEGDLNDLQTGDWAVTRTGDAAITSVRPNAASRQGLKRVFEPVLQSSALATLLMRRIKPTLERWGVISGQSAKDRKYDLGLCKEAMSVVFASAIAEGPVVAMFLPQLDYLPARFSRMTRTSSEESRFFQAAAARAGVPFYVADDVLVKQYARTGQPGHGFANARVGAGHLNANGHQAVAIGLGSFLGQILPAGGD